jgi:galactose mutarotase-like enzyme
MVELRSDQLRVKINPKGAELSSVKTASGTECMWQGDKNIWPRHAPVLFPIVGRLKDNAYFFEDKSYTLSQHGFARDLDFELIAHSEAACTFRLMSSAETKSKFPFEFILDISYRVHENEIETFYSVKNPAGKILFFSIGAHPGFNCPLLPGENFSDYYLLFETSELVLSPLWQGLRTGDKTPLLLKENKLQLSPVLFYDDAMVFEHHQVQKISLCSSRSQSKITMMCKDWPYFGIWTKAESGKENPGFICLEPWYGIADKITSNGNLLEKEGVLTLAPGEEFSCSFITGFYL